jgi:hypothetical protein
MVGAADCGWTAHRDRAEQLFREEGLKHARLRQPSASCGDKAPTGWTGAICSSELLVKYPLTAGQGGAHLHVSTLSGSQTSSASTQLQDSSAPCRRPWWPTNVCGAPPLGGGAHGEGFRRCGGAPGEGGMCGGWPAGGPVRGGVTTAYFLKQGHSDALAKGGLSREMHVALAFQHGLLQ